MTPNEPPENAVRRRGAAVLAFGVVLLVANHLFSLQLGGGFLLSTLFGPVFIAVGGLLLARPHLAGEDRDAITQSDRALVVGAVSLSLVAAVLLWGLVYAEP